MKILINKTDKNILPITKIYDLGSVTTTIDDLLNESTITLEKNITPILSIDGSNYLINNFNSTNIKEDFEAIITESDLISLGGSGSSEPVDSRPYKVYTALLTQLGATAPIATVLENTLGGEVVWSYEGAGDYSATLLGRFTVDRTYATVNCPDNRYVAQIIRVNEDEVSLTINPSEDTVSNTYPFTIEIRVYN